MFHRFLTCKPLVLLILCVIVSFARKAIAQTTLSNFRLYTVRDGLASNYVTSLMIDSRGYLWVGTQEGINRFDGTSFTDLITDAKDFTSRTVECITQLNDSITLLAKVRSTSANSSLYSILTWIINSNSICFMSFSKMV